MRKISIIYSLLLVLCSSWARAGVTVMQAVGANAATARITGAFVWDMYRESVDQEGLHYGKCMAIALTNNTSDTLHLVLNAGTLLMPADTSVQVMVVTHDVFLRISPHESYKTNVYAMCAQMHKYAPGADDVFTIGGDANTDLMKLVKYLEHSYNQNIVGQHAVWAYTDNATHSDLEQYGADDNSIRLTIDILDSAGVVTPLNRRPPTTVAMVHGSPLPVISLLALGFAVAAVALGIWKRRPSLRINIGMDPMNSLTA